MCMRCLQRLEMLHSSEMELQLVVSCLTWVLRIKFKSSGKVVCALIAEP